MKTVKLIGLLALGAMTLEACKPGPSRTVFSGPKAILVYPNLEKVDAGYQTCTGGEMWQENGKYSVRFEGKEIHGLTQVIVEEDRSVSLYCASK
jgi:hypothetical protein